MLWSQTWQTPVPSQRIRLKAASAGLVTASAVRPRPAAAQRAEIRRMIMISPLGKNVWPSPQDDLRSAAPVVWDVRPRVECSEAAGRFKGGRALGGHSQRVANPATMLK